MLPLLRPHLRSLVPLVLAGSLWVQAARPAAAQVDLGGSNITLRLRIPDEDGDFEFNSNVQQVLEFMNLANCTCEDTNFEVEFGLEPRPATVPSGTEQVEVWVGVGCLDEDRSEQQNQCFLEPGLGEVDDLLRVVRREISVRHLVGPTESGPCTRADEDDRLVYATVEEGSPDGFDEGVDYQNSIPVRTDTMPPPEPVNIRARGAEGAAVITWDQPTSREDDVFYFQVLCARVEEPDNPAGFGGFDQLYLTSQERCGVDDDGVCPRLPSAESERIIPGGGPDAGPGEDAGTGEPDAGEDDGQQGECVTDLPAGLANLDPAFLCGQANGTATSVRVGGLTNGVPYRLVLLAIDRARNVTALSMSEPVTPQPVQDFWEDYKDQGGRATGGCSAAQAGLGGGLALVLALGLGLGLHLVSRRRRIGGGRGGPGAPASGAMGGAALLLAIALSPGRAAAQPWWEGFDEEPVQEALGPSRPSWGLEFKFGPYMPDVDSEFNVESGERGPFEAMYGDGPFLLSQFTLDHFFLYPLGQLGLSFTAGFLTRSANAFQLDEDGNTVDMDENGRPDRSVGDTTTFRLFPASLGVVYRYTQLDDQLNIPLVPYGRVGLSYYTWWVTRPGGSTAEVPTDSCPDIDSNDCEGDRARGGSLGWQATAGLAVRAERIDPQAELSLRNELGVDHAGLVFEFTYARVDGFGARGKLAVGDATFFGGINFEF